LFLFKPLGFKVHSFLALVVFNKRRTYLGSTTTTTPPPNQLNLQAGEGEASSEFLHPSLSRISFAGVDRKGINRFSLSTG